MVDEAIRNENKHKSPASEMESVFQSILSADDLDIRDKKSALIDFIAAGIETVSTHFSIQLLF